VKAIVQNGYGGPDVLELKEVERPRIREDQVLVKVLASSVNAGDLFAVRGSPAMIRFSLGFPRPRTTSSAGMSRGSSRRPARM
jgi:NADPH:quinone reductase-like Zn-dependent oxidoreductase